MKRYKILQLNVSKIMPTIQKRTWGVNTTTKYIRNDISSEPQLLPNSVKVKIILLLSLMMYLT